MTGRRGEDVYVKVPCGTLVSERLSQSQLLGSLDETDFFGNEPDAHDIDPPSVDLDEHGKCILVARGGKPGLGNKALSGGKGKLFRSAVRLSPSPPLTLPPSSLRRPATNPPVSLESTRPFVLS
jgi:GTPase involved in cell partitioning and DNA repair